MFVISNWLTPNSLATLWINLTYCSCLDGGSECVDSDTLWKIRFNLCCSRSLYSTTVLRANRLGLLVFPGIALVYAETVPRQESLEILFMPFVRSVNLHFMACKHCSISHCWSCCGAVTLSLSDTEGSQSPQYQCSDLNSTKAANILSLILWHGQQYHREQYSHWSIYTWSTNLLHCEHA